MWKLLKLRMFSPFANDLCGEKTGGAAATSSGANAIVSLGSALVCLGKRLRSLKYFLLWKSSSDRGTLRDSYHTKIERSAILLLDTKIMRPKMDEPCSRAGKAEFPDIPSTQEWREDFPAPQVPPRKPRTAYIAPETAFVVASNEIEIDGFDIRT
jgi:hypothetical protein